MQPDYRSLLYSVMSFFIALALAIAIIVAFKPHAAKAGGPMLELGGSVGGALSSDELKSGSTKLDLSQTGIVGSAEAALLFQSQSFLFGPMARYSYMHDSGAILGSSLTTTNLYEVGLKFGYRATAATDVYGLAGWNWKDLALTGMSTKTPSGLMLGAGIEHMIARTPWTVKLEYTWDQGDAQTFGTGAGSPKLTPDLNVVRLGFAYRFGEVFKADLFDASKLPPEASACDSKLANCKPMK